MSKTNNIIGIGEPTKFPNAFISLYENDIQID